MLSDVMSFLGKRGGKKGGKSRSPKKIAAVRQNGKLGGRPRKQKKSENDAIISLTNQKPGLESQLSA